ncbi:hypothetical protein AABC73_02865 [Pseudomonas sp. G.S.17]|uniref:hypothetical protein n=1 Tax=Pseudomonas sp. G.S.17 TaxID=3137451 RepID=UPI00311CA394
MAKWFDWLFWHPAPDRKTRSETHPRPVLPTPDAGPVRPSSPVDAAIAALPAVKNWSHPFRDKRDPLLQLTQMAKAAAGFYPLGRSGLWHGGVHFDGGTAGTLDQSSVHCLADGEVVAYRIDQHSPTTGFFVNKLSVQKPFSRNFVLVRHRLQAPKIDGSADTPPSLTFFSLYMHLQDWAVYRDDPAITRPPFWPEAAIRRVKSDVKDPRPGQPEQVGLNVRNKNWQGKVLDLLPRGAEVTISGQGDFRKLENTPGPTFLQDGDGKLLGYLASHYLEPLAAGEYRIRCDSSLRVRAEANFDSKVIGELPHGTEVTVSGTGHYRKLERVNQYVHFKSLLSALEPQAHDQVVVLEKPVPIKAGDLIGHIGQYQDCYADQPEQKLHLEVFSGDNVKAFIAASRAWAQRLPATSKTWLKLAKGSAVVTHQERFNAKQPPTLNAPHALSDADLLVPKSLLDGLPPEKKIAVAATPDKKACNWYRLDGLLHDANNTLLDGWVREEVGVTPWFSPWAWEGYDVIFNYDVPRKFLASYLRAVNQFSEAQLAQYGALADDVDQGPVMSRLFAIIDRDRDGKMSGDEIQAALNLPAHAQSISQLIIDYETEWVHRPRKWDAMDEMLGHSGSTPHLNWLAEKERIKQLSWWDEVAEKVGLDSWAKVCHFHPVGLVGCFQGNRFVFTLEIMKELYPKLATSRHSDLKAIADELNDHIDFYKLDTPLRRTHFFAQILEETGEVLQVEENFTYKTTALTALFSYFRAHPDEARMHGYVTKQGFLKENGLPMGQSDYEAIANGAYGGRAELGNRGHSSADGWRYRGRGLKQLTGRYNYQTFNKWHAENQDRWPMDNVDFVTNPDMLLDMKYAVRSAVSFWLDKRAFDIADRGSAPEVVDLITDLVNKGTGSRSDRKEHFKYHWSKKTLE